MNQKNFVNHTAKIMMPVLLAEAIIVKAAFVTLALGE